MVENVVITGGTAGVGRAVARRFAGAGANVTLLARGADGLDGACDDVRDLGGHALGVPTDVADADAVEAAATAAEREFGPIDVWINCAMATIFAPLAHITPDEFRRATEVTYLGCVHGTMAALRRMRPRDRGSIVQVGSALAYRAIPLQSAYCGAKFAIRGFTDSLRSELLHDRSNVHLTMVQLPAVNTPQFDWACNKMGHAAQPVPPIFQPEVAAQAIYFAAHARRREVWVGGSAVKAIIANKIVPGLLDRYLARTAYAAQIDPALPSREGSGNLFGPAPGDHGAHGRFSDRAKSRSAALWASLHRRSLGLVGASADALFGLARGSPQREPIGRKRWVIPEGYIPSESLSDERSLVSHETACILNPNDRPAHASVTIYFADRDPLGPYRIDLAPRRTLHLRFNDLRDPPVPRDTDYSSEIVSDVPIVVQHTRLDSRQARFHLLSTIAYPA
jgi:NAD(P)-dependent dehydrogenase (short-subunit alcohol dehydrogenase family)